MMAPGTVWIRVVALMAVVVGAVFGGWAGCDGSAPSDGDAVEDLATVQSAVVWDKGARPIPNAFLWRRTDNTKCCVGKSSSDPTCTAMPRTSAPRRARASSPRPAWPRRTTITRRPASRASPRWTTSRRRSTSPSGFRERIAAQLPQAGRHRHLLQRERARPGTRARVWREHRRRLQGRLLRLELRRRVRVDGGSEQRHQPRLQREPDQDRSLQRHHGRPAQGDGVHQL